MNNMEEQLLSRSCLSKALIKSECLEFCSYFFLPVTDLRPVHTTNRFVPLSSKTIFQIFIWCAHKNNAKPAPHYLLVWIIVLRVSRHFISSYVLLCSVLFPPKCHHTNGGRRRERAVSSCTPNSAHQQWSHRNAKYIWAAWSLPFRSLHWEPIVMKLVLVWMHGTGTRNRWNWY